VTEASNSSLKIYPGIIRAAQIKTYEDHRMAMSFALLAARIDQLIIEEPNVVEKSFPTFWSELAKAGIKSRSI
jgi:3-phosphoshikimate 1-carboxyvinyltransferase